LDPALTEAGLAHGISPHEAVKVGRNGPPMGITLVDRGIAVVPVEGVSTPHAACSLKVVCSSAEREGNGNHGTRGVIQPTEYLVSFGGNSSGVFYLAKVSGFDPLTALLRKVGVPTPAMRVALQVLMAEPRHRIPDVTLTQDHFRELGLSD
jgi:hypothetical protein